MEPIDLTCAKCNTSWKLIKAEGVIACPYCKAIVDSLVTSNTSQPVEPTPVGSESIPIEAKPAETAAAPMDPIPSMQASTPVALPADLVDDADDPGVRADYDDRHQAPRRSGMHPLLKVFIILLILFILVPLAVIVLFAVVCAVMFSGG